MIVGFIGLSMMDRNVALSVRRAGEMMVCKIIEDDAAVSLRVAGDWTPPGR